MTDPGSKGRVTMIQVLFTTYQKCFKYNPHKAVNQQFFKPLLRLVRSSTNIIVFPSSISSEDGV